MKLVLTCAFVTMITMNARPAFAWNQCRCTMSYHSDNGDQKTIEADADCPDGDSFDLDCTGDEFARNVTATCTNHATGQSNSNESFPGAPSDMVPDSPWPSCSLW